MGEPCGIPFYLPKPLLVVSKNVYHIEDPKVGLTRSAPIPGTFDSQSSYGDAALNSEVVNATSPGSASKDRTINYQGEVGESIGSEPILHSQNSTVDKGPAIPVAPESGTITPDGLAPHVFYTYEIVFVPDLKQKYVLDVSGGAGEIRAALNLVNGWQFTGLGPYYMKDSSTAQNIFSRGIALNLGLSGASDVITSVAELTEGVPGPDDDNGEDSDPQREAILQLANLFQTLSQQPRIDMTSGERLEFGYLEKYAEVRVYEQVIHPDGTTNWVQMIDSSFGREYIVDKVISNGAQEMFPSAVDAFLRLSQPSREQTDEKTDPATGNTMPENQFSQSFSLPSSNSTLLDSPIARDIVYETLAPTRRNQQCGLLGIFNKPAIETRRVTGNLSRLPSTGSEPPPFLNQNNIAIPVQPQARSPE